MAKVYFSLGSNKGDRLDFILRAIRQLEKTIGTLVANSSVFESEPWGFTADTAFYNMVVQFNTKMSSAELLASVTEAELKLGRSRDGNGYSSRTIDIDILFVDQMLVKSETLAIPHPRMHLRRFVLEPLLEISPEMIHPLFNITVFDLMKVCQDTSALQVVLSREAFFKQYTTFKQTVSN